MAFRRLLPALVISGMLAACAQLPAASPVGAMPDHGPARATPDSFFMTGRIAVNHGTQHYAANISWQHRVPRDEIFLSTPLGQGIAELTRDAEGARLTTADQRAFTAPDWQALSARVFGVALPLTGLPRWLLAEIPAEALAVKYDGGGRPLSMVADGWLVAYLEYASVAVDALPSLIELKREDIEVRLKVDDWLPPR